ncbi:MAG: preprotein translocase subunit SecA [Oligoflexia bacterium]|nr:preprotein translocase subunit SecA [Oligoflexia bacterium]
MLQGILKKVFGTRNERVLKGLYPRVGRINQLEPEISKLSDAQLQAKTSEFKNRIANGQSLDEILPEAFAVCREAGKRVLGMRHFDVQLIGGMVLHGGNISEMKTGEGKTLVATLPTYLNALSGEGVHVVTVNDYLAKRDSEWMGRLYKWLGLSVGTIVHDLTDQQRKEAYGSDITYGTNNEFGFDYLRDNMKPDLAYYVQRGHGFAIVDEVDSILVDEARTPLIISGPSEESTDKYYVVNGIIPKLRPDIHFKIEEKSKTASLTDDGNHEVEKLLGIENLYDPQHIELLHHVYQGLKAHHLYKRDVDYMVKDGQVIIVDEFTGRLMPGRRWSDGLHQAIEAKEAVKVANENQTLATVTFQNYFRMYKKLAGMTGTADTEAAEFKKIYNLDVVVIPTNRPMVRKDMDDLIYKTEKGKYEALIKDIKDRHEKGQPVLVGTVSIEKSELLSTLLKRSGLKHTVLNAKHHEREAEIVAQAGRKGAVTIATNMAGRGTDIMLGGNPEFLARNEAGDDPEKLELAMARYKELCKAEHDEVVALGGLHIIGTERHESRRIDNQLRGRAGRQGDPGSTRFYLSLEDNLMRIFNGERIQKIMNMMNIPEDEAIESGMVTRAVEGAQRKVEGHNFDIRKHLLEYDDVMNVQREAIYGLRRQALEGDHIEEIVKEMINELAEEACEIFTGKQVKAGEWDLEGLNQFLSQKFGVKLGFTNGLDPNSLSNEKLQAAIKKAPLEVYDRRKQELGPDIFTRLQKDLLLMAIDARWKDHLLSMDHLKEGINLRAYGQKDPLVEYKKEAFNLYSQMDYSIKTETIEHLMKIQVASEEQVRQMEVAEAPKQQKLIFSRGEESETPKTVTRTQQKVGRNDPCPCGSGKKYKKCHGADEA